MGDIKRIYVPTGKAPHGQTWKNFIEKKKKNGEVKREGGREGRWDGRKAYWVISQGVK